MPRITLACYSIRVRERNAHDTLDLSDPSAAGLFAFFVKYFDDLSAGMKNNTADKKVLGIISNQVSGTEISGVLQTGEYGYESNLIDTKGKKKTYRRSKDEAEMLPFYFLLYLPKSGDCGVLILQRFGVFGVRSILTQDLGPKFDDAYPNLTLNIWPQVPDGVLQALVGKGSLRAITLRKLSLPADICDTLGEDAKNDPGSIDLVISSKQGHSFGSILQIVRNILNGKTGGSLNEVVEVKGFKHDRTLLEIEIGERRQTIDLTNLNKLRAHIDITQKIRMGDDGHPTLASISAEAQALLAGIRTTLRI